MGRYKSSHATDPCLDAYDPDEDDDPGLLRDEISVLNKKLNDANQIIKELEAQRAGDPDDIAYVFFDRNEIGNFVIVVAKSVIQAISIAAGHGGIELGQDGDGWDMIEAWAVL